MRAVARSLLVVVAFASLAHAQPVQQAANTGRHPITVADIKAWNSLRGATLSNDGKWFAYVVGPAEGDATLYVKSTTDATKETKYAVGGTGGGTFTISGDSSGSASWSLRRVPRREPMAVAVAVLRVA